LPKRLIAIAVVVIGVVSLTSWGLLRGYQLRFAASLAGNPLGQFLGAHSALAAAFFIFITLATPIIGAAALFLGWQELSHARMWRSVRGRFETLRTDEIHLARKIQADTEHLKNLDKQRQAQCLEWRAIFAQFYERGQRHGARQETRWSVLRKSLLGGLCATPFAFLVPLTLFPAQLAVPAIAGLGFFTYFNHRRSHPSHERYLSHENTQFAVPDVRPARELRVAQQRLLPKGDE
jgi:hypothetical protein